MDDRERAKRLLERLRLRTEARGATAAEAAQAAELAEKIIRRYGIQPDAGGPQEIGRELDQAVCPGWVQVLGLGIATRFRTPCKYTRQRGKRSTVIFVGEEHIASVSAWLFSAVYTDINRRSHREAEQRVLQGPDLVRFRGAYARSAAWEVFLRLNPPARKDLATCREESAQKPRRNSRALARQCERLKPYELDAMIAGGEFGKQLSLDTTVLGDRRRPVLALEG